MTARRALSVFGASVALFFACATQAFADGRVWAAVGTSMSARLLLAAGSIAFTAALTRGPRTQGR